MDKKYKYTTPLKKVFFLHLYFQWNYNTLYTKYLLQVLNIKSSHKRPRKLTEIITISWQPSPSVWVGWSVLWQCSQPSLTLNWPSLTLSGLCPALWQISFHFFEKLFNHLFKQPLCFNKIANQIFSRPRRSQGLLYKLLRH